VRYSHTYSCYERGVETINALHWLDLMPRPRRGGLSFAQAWVRHHDRYDSVIGTRRARLARREPALEVSRRPLMYLKRHRRKIACADVRIDDRESLKLEANE